MEKNEDNENIIVNTTNIDNSNNPLNKLNIENSVLNKLKYEYKEKEDKKEEKGEAEQNLMFGVKKIFPFRLYYHISGKFEIFLMITGAIFTIGAGCTGALISVLLGDTINDFSSTAEIENLPEIEYKKIMDNIEPSINKMVKKYLIIGALLFICNFCMMFFWAYSSLRQMHWMKINYFYLILRQEQGWFDENNAFEFVFI